MKRVAYIFILLFCFGFKLISANTEPFFALKQLPVLGKYENNSKEKSPVSLINTKDYPSSNKILTEKKIRARGLVSVFYLFIDDSYLPVGSFGKKLTLSSQTVYFFRLFLGNEKRGPPVVLVS